MFRGVGHGSNIDLVIYVLTLNGDRQLLSTKIAFILQDFFRKLTVSCLFSYKFNVKVRSKI